MLKIICEADDPALMELVWSFRHQRFVADIGWEELRRPDHRERDAFDTSQTIHAILVNNGEVLGYSRLLPTTLPHLTRDFCQRSGVATPAGKSIYEWSRCAVAVDVPDIHGYRASDLLMTGVLECLVELGAKTVIFLTYHPIIRMMRRRGYPVRKLCSLTLSNGDRIEAVSSALSMNLLFKHRHRHNISRSLLEWGPSITARRIEPPAAA